MLYNFRVHEKHRDNLRFFWFENNNFQKPLIQYRMKVHIFGNTQSRVTVSYGLRKASLLGDNYVRDFVNKNFYVDNGPTSLSIEQEATHQKTHFR